MPKDSVKISKPQKVLKLLEVRGKKYFNELCAGSIDRGNVLIEFNDMFGHAISPSHLNTILQKITWENDSPELHELGNLFEDTEPSTQQITSLKIKKSEQDTKLSKEPLTELLSHDTKSLPPFYLEAERAVLGALLLEKEAYPRVKDKLHANIFYIEKHKIIASAILEVAAESGMIDILTITNKLRIDGTLDAIGGPLYITSLTTNVASSRHIGKHVDILVELFESREKELLRQEIGDRLVGPEDLDKVIDEAKERLSKTIKLSTIELPIDGLPDFLQSLITTGTLMYGGHRDFWTASLLAATGLSIGKASKILTKYSNFPILWWVIVSPSGANKTKPINFALNPFHSLDDVAFKAQQIIEGQSIEMTKQFIISDFTPESLVRVHSINTRGVCIHRDEIYGWLLDIGRYQKSGELQNWMSAWSGEPIVYNRITKTLKIQNPCISILGGIQDNLLNEFAKEYRSESGFMQRFNWIYPDYPVRPIYNEKELPDFFLVKYNEYIHTLLLIDNQDIRLSIEAHRLYTDYVNQNTIEINHLSDNVLRSIVTKLDIICLRLALIVHWSKWACSGIAESSVTAATMDYAIRFCGYLRFTGEKVYRSFGIIDQEVVNNKTVAPYLRSKGHSEAEVARILKVSQQYINKILKK